MAKSSIEPTFIVRLVGPGITPESVPFRTVSSALSAVQDLATGRDPFEQRQVDPDKLISLSQVRSGSAAYACFTHVPEDAREKLSRVGTLLSSLARNNVEDDDGLVAALRPIESLSELAKKLKCQIEISFAGRKKTPIFTVHDDAFKQISNRLLLHGDTTVIGIVQRAGGATGMRCLLRVPGRHKGLYCGVQTKDLVRRLGKHLYEPIAAKGTATWIHRTWRIYDFTIKDFAQPKLANPSKVIESLRNAGLDAWDDVPNPETYLQELGP